MRFRWILLTGVLLGCLPPRPTLLSNAVVSPSPAPPPGLTGNLAPNDIFEVRVYQEPDLSMKFRVGQDGNIDFPMCGRVSVSGQTTSEVASKLRDCLTDYIKKPQVSVLGLEVGSHRKIYVFGHVLKPGTFPFEEQMSVIEAITVAGGFSQFAGQNSVTVTRITPAGDKKFVVPVQDIGTGKAPNFYLLPGDIIFVPESFV